MEDAGGLQVDSTRGRAVTEVAVSRANLAGQQAVKLDRMHMTPLSFLSDPLLSIAQPFFLSSAREFKLSRTFFIY